jgi:hypothetical protein
VVLLLLVCGLGCGTAYADIKVLGVQYRQDQNFPEFDCYWSSSGYPNSCTAGSNYLGATVHVFLQNTGVSTISITDATLAGYSLKSVIKCSTQTTINPKLQNSIYFYWDSPETSAPALMAAGEPVWYKADPTNVPPGRVAQMTVRLRHVPTNPISLGVMTTGGNATTNITVDNTVPRVASIGYSDDRTKVYLHWRRNGGAAPTAVWMDGTNVTSLTTTVGDANLDFAASVISLTNALGFFSYHVYQGVYADGKMASAWQRAWTNKFIYTTWSTFVASGSYTAASWVNEAADHGFNNVGSSLF